MSDQVQMISHPLSGGSIKGTIKCVELFQTVQSGNLQLGTFYHKVEEPFSQPLFWTFNGLQPPSLYHFTYNDWVHNSGGKVLFLENSLLLISCNPCFVFSLLCCQKAFQKKKHIDLKKHQKKNFGNAAWLRMLLKANNNHMDLMEAVYAAAA